MVQDTPRREGQRGWSRVLIWGFAIAAVVAVVVVAVPVLNDVFVSDRAGLEGTTKTPADVAEEASAPATVAAIGVKQGTEYGTYLTDGEGRPLYLFEGDEQGQGERAAVSTCYEDCAKAWPPVTTTDTPRTVSGVNQDMLGTVERRDGTQQVTYNGWPLYLFAKDFDAEAEPTGQDVEDFGAEWYLVTPSGEKVGHAEEGTG